MTRLFNIFIILLVLLNFANATAALTDAALTTATATANMIATVTATATTTVTATAIATAAATYRTYNSMILGDSDQAFLDTTLVPAISAPLSSAMTKPPPLLTMSNTVREVSWVDSLTLS